MKKFVLIAVLAAALAALLAGTALAAEPVTTFGRGFGPGAGIHTPGTGLTTPNAGGMGRRGAPSWAGQPEEVATLLGMTAEQIQTERLAGKSLAQIAGSKGIDEADLVSTILAAKKTDLTALVAEGRLTQAQMDTMVQFMQSRIATMVARTGVGPSFEQGQARPGAGSGMGQGFRGGRGANR